MLSFPIPNDFAEGHLLKAFCRNKFIENCKTDIGDMRKVFFFQPLASL